MSLTADDVVNLFEKDVSARKRLAELLVSEPDVRLALINAVIRDVATKEDIEGLRKEIKGEIQELRNEMIALNEATKRDIESLRKEIKGEIQELRNEINDLRKEINDLRKEMIALNEATKRDIEGLRNEINDLRKEMSSNFKWTIGVIITVWAATVIPILLKLIGLL